MSLYPYTIGGKMEQLQKKYMCRKLNVSLATLDRRIAEHRKKLG